MGNQGVVQAQRDCQEVKKADLCSHREARMDMNEEKCPEYRGGPPQDHVHSRSGAIQWQLNEFENQGQIPIQGSDKNQEADPQVTRNS